MDSLNQTDILAGQLHKFSSIELEEMRTDSLLKRREKKFFFALEKLESVLEAFSDDFKILEIAGERIHQYNSTYLDTDNFDTYLRHHNGRKNRFKLRYRDYDSSEVSFFEIKQKTNTELTVKHRKEIPYQSRKLNGEISSFVSEFIDIDFSQFDYSIDTSYKRITLVSAAQDARITIDMDLSLSYKNEEIGRESLVIMEMKFSKGFPFNFYLRALKNLNILPHRISKYCIGISYLIPEIKKNNFKMNLRRIKQIQRLQMDI